MIHLYHGTTHSPKLSSQAMSKPVRLAIVEDASGFRRTLEAVFGSAPDFEVAAACANGEDALRQIPGARCQMVIMDINLPGMSGIDCLRELKALVPGLRVVMLTAFDDNENLFKSLAAGADGYLLKRFARDRLLEAVRDILNGGTPISPQIARMMIEYFHKTHASGSESPAAALSPGSEVASLTAREREVLALLAQGYTPKEVADQLRISWPTVRNFIRFIYDKLHVHTRTDAVLKYLGRAPTLPKA
jgi:DNA-binding NarL/FixJ family response regulator